MREIYNQRLEDFNSTQQALADLARTIMEDATEALLTANLEKAERIVARSDEVDALKDTGEKAAFAMLALEAPVARDLRFVIAGIHIVADFARMAMLGIHLAKVTRQRHPEVAVPEPLRGHIAEMSRLGCHATETLKSIIDTADPEKALELGKHDDAVDDIHHRLFHMATSKDWQFSAREAVDITQLSRFLERYSDHVVAVGERVIFMATGMHAEEYADSVKAELERDPYDPLSRSARS